MVVSIKDLLKYKKEVPLKDAKDKIVGHAWVRLLGDEDLTQATKLSRVASTDMRATLRDTGSVDYKDRIEPMAELDRETLLAMVLSAHQNRYMSEAFVKVDREELPKIEEIATEPDAPTLEEQEQLDAAIAKQSADYDKRIGEFVDERTNEMKVILEGKTTEEILAEARQAMTDILPLQTFFEELNAQKAFRGTYNDKLCKERTFGVVEDYKDAERSIKLQLIDAYNELELDPNDLKNS